jgi:hypothetical protein
MAVETAGYDAGLIAGRIAERLDGHDRHLEDINGAIKDLVSEVHAIGLAVQRLGDAADADRATVIKTATALKEADQARRDTSESRWSPMAKTIAVIGVIATVIAAVAAIIYGLTGR